MATTEEKLDAVAAALRNRLKPDRYITLAQAADYLRISRRSIYNWMKSGELPWKHARSPYASRLVKLQDIYAIRPYLNPDQTVEQTDARSE